MDVRPIDISVARCRGSKLSASKGVRVPRAVQPRKAAVPRKQKVAPVSTAPTAPQITPNDISRRAYEIYEARGAAGGGPLDDWLRAERELSESAGA
jgi:DUF2934 family protein